MTLTPPVFKIEKNIPLPDGLRTTRWPMGAMKVGDSVLLPGEQPSFSSLLATLRVAASQTGIRLGRKYTVHLVPEGARCWRIK